MGLHIGDNRFQQLACAKRLKKLGIFFLKKFPSYSNSRFLSSFIEILIISFIIMFFKKHSFAKRGKLIISIISLTCVFVNEHQKRCNGIESPSTILA